MKITSVNKTLNFRGQNQDVNFDATKKEKEKKKYVDPLKLACSRSWLYNDIGIAYK